MQLFDILQKVEIARQPTGDPFSFQDSRQQIAARIATNKEAAFKGFGAFYLIDGDVVPLFGYRGWCSRPENHSKALKLLQHFKEKGVLWMLHTVPLIASNDEIDFASLTYDLSKAPLHMIKWKTKALEQGYVDAAGGQHRKEALRLLHEQYWGPMIEKAKQKVSKANVDTPGEGGKCAKEFQSLEREKKENTLWIAAVYERGKYLILSIQFSRDAELVV